MVSALPALVVLPMVLLSQEEEACSVVLVGYRRWSRLSDCLEHSHNQSVMVEADSQEREGLEELASAVQQGL